MKSIYHIARLYMTVIHQGMIPTGVLIISACKYIQYNKHLNKYIIISMYCHTPGDDSTID